jgi:hypothetical protein
MPFEMSVCDIFRFADGRTILVGAAESAPTVIDARCDLVIDGVVYQQIEVSEELAERRSAATTDRAVGTYADVAVTVETVRGHDVRLRELIA